MKQIPDFIIIGAMKCGTSTLQAQLARQPGFFLTTPKEPNFFSDDEIFARGAKAYAELFADAAPEDRCGEASTHYTKLPTYPETVERMAGLLEAPRLIYVMRHPVDRLVSHYIHEWTERTIESPIDDAALGVPRLVEYGCYARQLAPYFARFGREAVLPVFLERMHQAPQETLERIGRFLGHEEKLRWEAERGPANVSAERMRSSPWRDRIVDQPLLRSLRRRFVPKGLRDRVRSLWTLRERPQLSPGTREELERRFDADLAELGAWLGTPLDCASFRAQVSGRDLDWAEAPR